ncbi:MAG: PHP domain-containing protein [Chloroflexota bacterium]|nr:PHP domain-containing protein [Chloroflexota bacterium]
MENGPYRREPLAVDGDGKVVLPPGYAAAELHCHTLHSDGTRTVQENFALGRARGLAVVATTDHDMIDAARHGAEVAANHGIETVVGQEITTRRQHHIVGLYLQEAVPIFKSVPETVRRIRDQGGLAIVAHPFLRYPGATSGDRIRRWLDKTTFDGIELDCQYLSIERRERLVEFYRDHADRLGAAVGGTDAHFGDVGRVVTLFPGSTAADVRTALENRTTAAARTQIAYDGPSIGDRLHNQRRSLLYLPYYRLRALLTGEYR